ncbi:MAG: glucosamine-6-phosphate deaminase [Gammaproteobacteria bacterium]|nr:MAG: glucosamine-6-phosphate deaminase [Gammaproteobacteria bacterium]
MRFLSLYQTYDKWVADYIIKKINQAQPTADKPFVLGLPTGGSPLPVYRHLIEAYQQGKVSFKQVVTINMDEYIGLAPDHPQSYRYFMQENFFKHIDILPENTHVPNGMAADIDAEGLRYEQLIADLGGVDLFFGGVGSDGHIAFNEPGSSLGSRTRIKTLTQRTLNDNARFFDSIDDVPRTALTVGIQTVMDAKEVIILAKGLGKALAVLHAVEGAVNNLWPISMFQHHEHFILVCDELAATELKLKTLRYFAFTEGELDASLRSDLVCYPNQ